MTDRSAAETAIAQLNGADMNGRALNVKKPSKPQGGGGYGNRGGGGGGAVAAVHAGRSLLASRGNVPKSRREFSTGLTTGWCCQLGSGTAGSTYALSGLV